MIAQGRVIRRMVRRGGPAAAALLLGLVGVSAWMGCSVERNYKMLSFFFDGVPDPEQLKAAREAAALGQGTDIRLSPTYSVHKPYAEDKCADCHGGRLRLSKTDSSLCMKCHTDNMGSEPITHGPVAAGACLWCHAPHESAFKALMKSKPRDVCMQCHTAAMLVNERVPEHSDPAQDCLGCHFGHGSTERFMLRPSPTPRPEVPAGDGADRP